MRYHRLTSAILGAVLVVLWGASDVRAQTAPPIPAEEQPEVLTSGPVHEAFAEPLNVDDGDDDDDYIASKPPPPNIEELPPPQRPDGDRYIWVPGYWAWDSERDNYIWVSACWRVAPPNCSWVPGYWNPTARGYQWVPGFWSRVETDELEYLPAPPPSPLADLTPVGVAPAQDYVWVPPVWYWQQTQYVRRNGYWLHSYPNWVWVPSHNVWTPRGYVFVPGHWDYPLETRGVLFAPVRFREPNRVHVGYYSPSTVIDISIITDNLFTSPSRCHYYFGDYYDDSYARIGIYAWFDNSHRHGWYDPIYEYDRVHYRDSDRDWERHRREEFERRRNDRDLRPAKTLREQDVKVARLPEAQRKRAEVVKPLQTVVVNNTTNVKFTQINNDTRQTIAKKSADVNKFRDDRSKWETASAGARQTTPARDSRGTQTPAANQQRAPVNPQPAPDSAAAGRRDSTPAPQARDNTPPRGDPRGSDNARANRGATTDPDTVSVRGDQRGSDNARANRDATPDATPARSAQRGNDAARGSDNARGRDSATLGRQDTPGTPDRAGASSDRRGTATRRPVQAKEPERVKVPSPPIKGRADNSPSQPDDERRGGDAGNRRGDTRGDPRRAN